MISANFAPSSFRSGGYACFSAHFSDDTTNSVRAILKACAPVGVQRAFGIEYRVANLTPFPGIFADCLAGYVYLVRDCGFDPKNVILMGDSAGGE